MVHPVSLGTKTANYAIMKVVRCEIVSTFAASRKGYRHAITRTCSLLRSTETFSRLEIGPLPNSTRLATATGI